MNTPAAVLSILLDLTQRMTSDVSLEAILSEVAEASLKLLPGNHASIRVYDETHTELVCGARAGRGSLAAPLTMKKGEGVVGWVAEHGRLANISDISGDPRFKQGNADQGFVVRSILAVPLLSAGKVVGVLGVTSPLPETFAPEDEALALLLANCTVPLIDKARLERLAFIDVGTMAFNDLYLMPALSDTCERAKRSGSPLSVMMLELDALKEINAEQGFVIGHLVLRAFADRLRELAPGRRLIRRGGNVFVVISPDHGRVESEQEAERWRVDLATRPLELSNGRSVAQTVSVGVATWDKRESALELLKRVERALSSARAGGRDRVVSSSDLPAVDL